MGVQEINIENLVHLIGYKNMQNLYNIPDEVYLCYKSLKLYLIWYSIKL